MAHSLKSFCGLVLERKYRLDRFVGEHEEQSLFTTPLPDDDEGLVRIVPADAPNAVGLRRAWALASGLTHRNLLRVFATGDAELDGIPVVWAATEQPDDTLSLLIETRPLDATEGTEVLNALVDSLDYLHRNGLVHGAVRPDQIVAVGNSVKLSVNTLAPIDSRPFRRGLLTPVNVADDVAGLGATVVEMMTQQRPAAEADPEQMIANADLPSPFREIAIGCLRDERFGRWTLRRVREELDPSLAAEAQPVVVPASASPVKRLPVVMVAAGIVLLLLLAFGIRKMNYSAAQSAADSASSAAETRARVVFPPAPAAVPESPRPSPFTRTPPPATAASASNYAVVAAAYDQYDAALKRAQSLQSKWPGAELKVYPPKGEGRQYLVVVASGMTREQAERTRRKAVNAGFPKDSYVTRLLRG